MHRHLSHHITGYDVVLANTEESKNIHFNLRYQIYCLEKGYEEASKFKDELEKDEYDDRSAHFLIKHRADNQWIGVFRLIISNYEDLPICKSTHVSHLHRVDPHQIAAEFSRLAIIRPFQKLAGKKQHAVDDADMCIIFNAVSVGIEYSRKHGADKIYFLCRRSLTKVVNKMGIKTPQIGNKTVYRGTRYPYKLDLSDFPHKLFENQQAVQAFHRKNAYIHYFQASELEGRQTLKAAA